MHVLCTIVVRCPPMFALFLNGVCTISASCVWFAYVCVYYFHILSMCVYDLCTMSPDVCVVFCMVFVGFPQVVHGLRMCVCIMS